MIQIAIADDDAVFLAKIEKYVRKYQEENNNRYPADYIFRCKRTHRGISSCL